MDAGPVAGRLTGPTMNAVPDPPAAVDLAAQVGVLPVVTIHDVSHVGPLVDALVAGGLPMIEITLRTAAGLEAIRRASGRDQQAFVGAGSVRTAAEADLAADAGARFLVSPGLDSAIVRVARDRDIPIVPGVATPTELMQARSLGLEVLKFFPAEAAGGASAIAAMAAVFPEVRFLPTGGIGPSNLAEYLQLGSVVAVGGSWMVPAEALAAGDWDTITRAASAAVELVQANR